MERESNQLEAGPILCRTGCGFFGSPNTDGLCSKCYKDALKKKQQPPSSVTSPTSPAASSPAPPAAALHQTPAAATTTAQPTVPSLTQLLPSVTSIGPASSARCSLNLMMLLSKPLLPLIAISTPNPDLVGGAAADKRESGEEGGASASEDLDPASPDKDAGKKKKNKCQMCKKKVGLTGFTCRCEGLFCSVHRYSNEHRCTFDYREHGAEEIRRNNPVIKGEKIQKI